MSTVTIAIIVLIVLGLIVVIVFLLRWLKQQEAASPPEASASAPALVDIHVSYNKDTKKPMIKRNRIEQWNNLKARDYKDEPTSAEVKAKLFPCKLTVEYEYMDGTKYNKVYYATPEAVKKLGFL